MKDDKSSFTADRLKWRFRRFGGNGEKTRLFNELTADISRYLLERVPARVNEIPVIAYFADFGNWLILTTERLVWSNKNNVTSPEKRSSTNSTTYAESLRQVLQPRRVPPRQLPKQQAPSSG